MGEGLPCGVSSTTSQGKGPAPRGVQDNAPNLSWFRGGGEEKEFSPSPSSPEGVKNLKYSPSSYPLPRGERANILKLKRNFLPLDGGGEGGGEIRDFFTASLPPGEGIFSRFSKF